MTETEGSDALLGAEAIDAEQERVFREEKGRADEETIVREVDPLHDEDTEFDDDPPPDAEEHAEFEELPAPMQEI